ncbi:MAG: glycoside hydrolase family 3 protein [Spirochaetota bacterium]
MVTLWAVSALGFVLLLSGCDPLDGAEQGEADGNTLANAESGEGAESGGTAESVGAAETAEAAETAGPSYVEPAPARYGDKRDRHIEELMSAMSLEEKIGQLLVLGLMSPDSDQPLTEVVPRTEEMLREVRPGGVVLYGGNIEDVGQVTALIDDLQSAAEIPLFVGIDEEGGVVSRLKHLGSGVATHLPSAAEVGVAGETLSAYRAGRLLGRELRSLGFNINFAPTVDVSDKEANPFLDSRTYSADPHEVARLAVPFLRGLQNHGVSASIKHFPGHGSAVEDSHYGLSTVAAGAEELRSSDWVPFRKAIEAGVDSIMVAHVMVPSLTEERVPASISPAVVQEAAREELGFDGLLISDSVTMGGLLNALDERSAAVAVVEAGGDIVLTPGNPYTAVSELVEAVEEGRITEERIDESVRRVLRVKLDRGILVPSDEAFERRFPHVRGLDPREVLSAPEHREVVEQIRRRAAEEEAR